MPRFVFMSTNAFVIGLALLSCEAALAQSVKPEKKAASPPKTAIPENKTTSEKDSEAYFQEKLATEDMLADLAELDGMLKEKWALVDANGVDFSAEIAALKSRVSTISARFDFNLEVQKILTKGIDGHMAVGGPLLGMSSFWRDNGQVTKLPFVVDLSGDRYVAYQVEHLEKGNPANPSKNHRNVPIREGLPYVLEIDGIPIERWIEVASEFVSKGSVDAVRARATAQLVRLGFYRKRLGLENLSVLRVKLTSQDRARTAEVELPIQDRWHARLPVPRPESKLLDGNVGYLFFENVTANSVQLVLAKMPEFKTTNGLVVDLRENYGGAPGETLTFLAAFLLPEKIHTMIAGACEVEEESLNSGHGFFTPKTPGMTEADVQLMAAFDERYHPKWTPRNRTTPLHRTYVPLTNPIASKAQYMPWNLPIVRFTMTPKIYHYDKPVVVLVNHRTFSAGEGLAAMLRELPNVTLIGSTSIGGGYSSNNVQLGKTGLEVGFGIRPWVRANGELIDGKGVTPDVVAYPDPDYYFGRRDRVLEKAVELIKSGEARH